MKPFWIIASGALATATPAAASPVVYGMTFFDAGGATIGSGTFTYDPDVTVDIYDSTDGRGPCDPVAEPDVCVFLATWTPAAIEGALGPVSFGRPSQSNNVNLGALFAEGTYWYDRKAARTNFAPGVWNANNGDPNDHIALGLPFLVAGAVSGGGAFGIIDNYGLDLSGTVEYRLIETPLPGAALLFLSGLIALARRNGVTPLM